MITGKTLKLNTWFKKRSDLKKTFKPSRVSVYLNGIYLSPKTDYTLSKTKLIVKLGLRKKDLLTLGWYYKTKENGVGVFTTVQVQTQV